jgi:hypothetical protein
MSKTTKNAIFNKVKLKLHKSLNKKNNIQKKQFNQIYNHLIKYLESYNYWKVKTHYNNCIEYLKTRSWILFQL